MKKHDGRSEKVSWEMKAMQQSRGDIKRKQPLRLLCPGIGKNILGVVDNSAAG